MKVFGALFAFFTVILDVANAQANVAEVVIGRKDLSTLLQIASDLGLAGALNGPITVFAPTNGAFKRLDNEIGDEAALFLTSQANAYSTNNLQTIVLYHVVGQALDSSAVVSTPSVETLAEIDLDPLFADKKVNGQAKLKKADLTATDGGIVHVIKSVLIPEANFTKSIYQLLTELTPNLESIVCDLGLRRTLKGKGFENAFENDDGNSAFFTVLAPTDEAFGKIADSIPVLAANVPLLTKVILTHVIPGVVTSSDVMNATNVGTLSGEILIISGSTIGGAQIESTDFFAYNGPVHTLSDVIVQGLPSSFALGVAQNTMDLSQLVSVLELDFRFTKKLKDITESPGDYTFFLPTNEAFTDFFNENPNLDLTKKKSRKALKRILGAHFIPGQQTKEAWLGGPNKYPSQSCKVERDAPQFADEILTDLEFLNGIGHVVTKVIVPDCAQGLLNAIAN